MFLLAEIDGKVKPSVFFLIPTSISARRIHKKKLERSKQTVVSVNTTFELGDVKQARDQFGVTKVISSHDWKIRRPSDTDSGKFRTVIPVFTGQ